MLRWVPMFSWKRTYSSAVSRISHCSKPLMCCLYWRARRSPSAQYISPIVLMLKTVDSMRFFKKKTQTPSWAVFPQMLLNRSLSRSHWSQYQATCACGHGDIQHCLWLDNAVSIRCQSSQRWLQERLSLIMSSLPYHKGNKTNFINLLFTLTPDLVLPRRPGGGRRARSAEQAENREKSP